MLNKEEGNSLISKLLLENNNFAVSRIGLGELRWIDWFIKGGINSNCDGFMFCGPYFTPTFRERLTVSGIYGNTFESFFEEYIKGISCGDVQIEWKVNEIENQQKNIFEHYSKESIKVDVDSLTSYMHKDFWSKNLKNKKVLVIYPFVKTIEMQFLKKDKIWTNEHSGKLPEFELLTYKPFWSMADDKPHNSWKETLEIMKNDISKLDFDVAILGCSHYGLPLVAHIKNIMKKTAIYMGGETQILFGIKGKRWDEFKNGQSFYNEHWTRQIDLLPNSAQLMDNGCYL